MTKHFLAISYAKSSCQLDIWSDTNLPITKYTLELHTFAKVIYPQCQITWCPPHIKTFFWLTQQQIDRMTKQFFGQLFLCQIILSTFHFVEHLTQFKLNL